MVTSTSSVTNRVIIRRIDRENKKNRLWKAPQPAFHIH